MDDSGAGSVLCMTAQLPEESVSARSSLEVPCRAIARDPSRLDPRARERIEVVRGSHDDNDVVTEAFVGADRGFWLVPPNLHAESLEGYYLGFTRSACETIKSQGVERVIGVSTPWAAGLF